MLHSLFHFFQPQKLTLSEVAFITFYRMLPIYVFPEIYLNKHELKKMFQG